MHDAMKAYHESWERELDRQFLKNDRYRKRAYICSPLSGSTAEEELSNIWRSGLQEKHRSLKRSISFHRPARCWSQPHNRKEQIYAECWR